MIPPPRHATDLTRLPLQAATPEVLAETIPGLSLEEARKIVGAVHRLDCLPGSVKMVRRTSLGAVRAAGFLPGLTVLSIQQSQVDPFVKYALMTPDGCRIETVRIPLERTGRFSVCVSSQAGCGLGCAFCATGQIGMHRNLEVWEIIEQVRAVRRGLDRARRQRVHGIVFQGMGEPLANAGRVIQAIRVLCEPSALAIDSRAITLCTAGIPSGIRRIAAECPKVRLAVSIGSARPEIRRALMPVDRVHPLDHVMAAVADYALCTRLAPMWAVTLLAGVNDTEADARALAHLARSFLERTGMRPQLRLIPYNPIDVPDREPFRRSDAERETAFWKVLHEEGFSIRKRYSGGADVHAACGQLAGRQPVNSNGRVSL
jgi:23S rRNA (adenine2503-C2)-methyltransferase